MIVFLKNNLNYDKIYLGINNNNNDILYDKNHFKNYENNNLNKLRNINSFKILIKKFKKESKWSFDIWSNFFDWIKIVFLLRNENKIKLKRLFK